MRLHGLHVRFWPYEVPAAEFTCACGFVSNAAGAGPVEAFVRDVPARHYRECVISERGRRDDHSGRETRQVAAKGRRRGGGA